MLNTSERKIVIQFNGAGRVVEYGEVNCYLKKAYLESLKSRCKTYPEGVVIVSKEGEIIGEGYRRVLTSDGCRSSCVKTPIKNSEELFFRKNICYKLHAIEMAIFRAQLRGNFKKLGGSVLYCVRRYPKMTTHDISLEERYLPREGACLVHNIQFVCCLEQIIMHGISVALSTHEEVCVVYNTEELIMLSGCGVQKEHHEMASFLYMT